MDDRSTDHCDMLVGPRRDDNHVAFTQCPACRPMCNACSTCWARKYGSSLSYSANGTY